MRKRGEWGEQRKRGEWGSGGVGSGEWGSGGEGRHGIFGHPITPLPRVTPQGYQVSESPEVSTVARQFIEANQAPWQAQSPP
jgi:putative transposase